MTRGRPFAYFALALLLLLLFQFRHLLAPGHSLYLSIIDDPGAWWSWYPWDVFSARSFRQGEFPLWNPLSGTGMPLLANFASAPLSPWKWPFYLFPHYRLLDAMVLARIWLLGLFMFLYLRRLGLDALPAAAGSLSLALSGYVMQFANLFNLATEMWLPAGLYLLHGQIQDRPTRRRFLLLALVSALALSGGNPEAAFYFMLFLILYALFVRSGAGAHTRKPWKNIFAAVSPLILAGLLMTVMGLPLLEYLGQGWHVHTGRLHALAPFAPGRFWSLLLPWLIGPKHSSPLQIFMLPYLGLTTVALALIAFAHLHRPSFGAQKTFGVQKTFGARLTPGAQPLLFFLLYSLVFLGFIFNLPGLRLLGEIPPFRESGNFKFAMFGITLGFASAAAIGLQQILSGRTDRRRSSLGLGLAVALAFAGIALAWKDPPLPPVQPAGWFLPLVILIVFAALIILLRQKISPADKLDFRGAPDSRRAFAVAIVALLALNLLLLYPGLDAQGEIDPAGIDPLHPLAPAYLQPIQEDPGRYRYLGWGQGVLHHSLNILYNLNDLRAFDALYPRNYVEAFSKIEGFAMKDSVPAFFQHGWSFDVKPENLGNDSLNLLGVKYFLTSEEIQVPQGWRLIGRDSVFIYENLKIYPRAFAVLTDNLEGQASATILDYEPQKVVIETETPASPARMVLTDTCFPGWQARVDGRPITIDRFAGLARSVRVPPGKSRVEMRYRPWGFRLGLWTTLVSGCLLTLVLPRDALVRDRTRDEANTRRLLMAKVG
jgi:hypothetical protein